MGRKKNGTRNRNSAQKESDMLTVARMYKSGRTFRDIGQELNLSHETVRLDLQVVKQRWRESAMVNLDYHLNEQLASIDAIEFQAWQSWHASVDNNNKEGNPAYLTRVQWCVEQRLKIFGLYEQPNAGDPGASINRAFLDAVREKVRVIEQETQAEMVAEYPALLDYVEGSLVDDSRN